MKTKYVAALAVLAFTAFSCKNKAEAESIVVAPPVKDNFIVEMDVVGSVKDDFTVYYTEDGTNNFEGLQAAWVGFKGDGSEEKLVVELPKNVIPTNIRLDFGINEARKDVVLKRLVFKYHEKTFGITGADFMNYFIKNDVPTEVDANSGAIKFIKLEDRKIGTFFYPRQELLDQIKLMTN